MNSFIVIINITVTVTVTVTVWVIVITFRWYYYYYSLPGSQSFNLSAGLDERPRQKLSMCLEYLRHYARSNAKE